MSELSGYSPEDQRDIERMEAEGGVSRPDKTITSDAVVAELREEKKPQDLQHLLVLLLALIQKAYKSAKGLR